MQQSYPQQHQSRRLLPPFEHSYETIIHKNVYSSYILIIPTGTPSYIWINKDGVFLQNTKEEKKIQCSTSSSLAKGRGTLFYGVYFHYKGLSFYAIEDIFYYKGDNISTNSYEQKIGILETILKREIQQQSTNNIDEIIIGLPIITTSEGLKRMSFDDIPYSVKYIQFRNNQKQRGNHRFQLPYNEVGEQFRVMTVYPDVENDIYYLFGEDNNSCGVACIPDYKTSVFMNSIFRNIKENANLDAIEESDDEENETNENIVELKKECKMNCKFHPRFKKWIPIEIV